GNARTVFAAGHGGISFVTVGDVGYLVIDGERPRVGLEEQLAALLVGGRRGDLSRARVERMTRQRLDIAEGGTTQVLGYEGRVYQLTLVEGEARTPPFEIIVSADPRLAPVGREILRHIDLLRAPIVAIAGSEPQPYAAARALFATGTPLRIGPMRLKEVEMRQPTPEMAALPGPVLGRAEFEAWLRETILREEDEAPQDVAPAEEEAPDGRNPR
ncbi:MAG TPA: hypothetical protein VLK25_08035, partial [Allosphingosinicella sp.]|nr:hypothetical protein [Allosphingosinicella sp.]